MPHPALIIAGRRQMIAPRISEEIARSVISGCDPQARAEHIVTERRLPAATREDGAILVAPAAPVIARPAAIAIVQILTIFLAGIADVAAFLAHIVAIA